MVISILGAGNVGCGVAADLTLKGHEVTLIKTSHAIHDENYNFLIRNNNKMQLDEFGDIKTAYIKRVTRDISYIKEADIIFICIQTNYHEELIKRIQPYLKDGHVLLFVPGYLSTAYVLKHCNEKKIICTEAESSFIDGRITELGLFKVGFRNARNPVGVYPHEKKEETFQKLYNLNENLVPLNSVVEAALHNPNLIVHTVGSVMSIPRIEIAGDDFCMYHEAYTRDNTATWKILEQLDKEKMNVLDKLGYERLSYVNACKYRNSLDDLIDAREVFLEYAEMDERAKGPVDLDSRYITEDVPEGLVMMEALGKSLKVRTPICTSLIEISGCALGRNLRKEGRTLKRLGIENVIRIIEDISM